MSEETVPAAAKKSHMGLLLWLAVGLAAVAVVVRWHDLVGAFQPKPPVVAASPEYMQQGFSFPKPLGPAGAKVKVHVVAHEHMGCQRELIALWLGIASLEPKRLRVEFSEEWLEKVKAPSGRMVPMSMFCQSGSELNGKSEFKVGEGATARTAQLHGPHPRQALPDGKPPEQNDHSWSHSDLAAILNRLLQEKYGSGQHLTGAAIAEAAQKADALVPAARTN
ncbi:MAG: hypothetical protein HYU66_06460 [Armatimonadetes bacterium]|nr:hypothetical protein [Armatimonadota bacterium]